MSVIKMPEGVELDLKVYLAGEIDGEEVEIVLTVGGLPAFADSVLERADLAHLVDSQGLDKLGSGWRVMSRAEITDYKAREREDA
jgi:hypothetical protein